MKGLEGNITTKMGLLTGDLADMIRQSPELIKEFENGDDYDMRALCKPCSKNRHGML